MGRGSPYVMPLEMLPAPVSWCFQEAAAAVLQLLSPEARTASDSALPQHNRLDGLQRTSQTDWIMNSIWWCLVCQWFHSPLLASILPEQLSVISSLQVVCVSSSTFLKSSLQPVAISFLCKHKKFQGSFKHLWIKTINLKAPKGRLYLYTIYRSWMSRDFKHVT